MDQTNKPNQNNTCGTVQNQQMMDKPKEKSNNRTAKFRMKGREKVKLTKREKMSEKYKQFQGSKNTGQGFADKRKQKMMNSYQKTLAKEKTNLEDWSKKLKRIYAENDQEDVGQSKKQKPDIKKKGKVSKFHKAEVEWKKRQDEKDQRKKEFLEKQKRKNEALAAYKNKKKKEHKKLSKKNYKGQPNMASQMDLLLQKLQSSS